MKDIDNIVVKISFAGMRKFTIAIISVVCMLFFAASGCGEQKYEDSADIEAFVEQLKSASSVIVPKENLPEWLVVKINEIEAIHSNDISIVKVRIFTGEWTGNAVYFIHNTLHSCVLCEVYYEDGERIVWTANDPAIDNFCITSKNWKLVYEFGNGI